MVFRKNGENIFALPIYENYGGILKWTAEWNSILNRFMTVAYL